MDKSLEGYGKPEPTRIGHQFLSLHKGNLTVVDENFVSENFQILISIFSGCDKIKSPSTPLKQVVSLTTSMLLFARSSLVEEYNKHMLTVARSEQSIHRFTKPGDMITYSTNSKNYPGDTPASYMNRNLTVVIEPLGTEMMYWLRPAISKFEVEYNVVLGKLEGETARKSFFHHMAMALYNLNCFQAVRRGFLQGFNGHITTRKPKSSVSGEYETVQYGSFTGYVRWEGNPNSSTSINVSISALVKEAVDRGIVMQELLNSVERQYSETHPAQSEAVADAVADAQSEAVADASTTTLTESKATVDSTSATKSTSKKFNDKYDDGDGYSESSGSYSASSGSGYDSDGSSADYSALGDINSLQWRTDENNNEWAGLPFVGNHPTSYVPGIDYVHPMTKHYIDRFGCEWPDYDYYCDKKVDRLSSWKRTFKDDWKDLCSETQKRKKKKKIKTRPPNRTSFTRSTKKLANEKISNLQVHQPYPSFFVYSSIELIVLESVKCVSYQFVVSF